MGTKITLFFCYSFCLSLVILFMTFSKNKDIFDTNPKAQVGFWFATVIFMIICIIIFLKPVIYGKCDNYPDYKYNILAFWPNF